MYLLESMTDGGIPISSDDREHMLYTALTPLELLDFALIRMNVMP